MNKEMNKLSNSSYMYIDIDIGVDKTINTDIEAEYSCQSPFKMNLRYMLLWLCINTNCYQQLSDVYFSVYAMAI